VSRALETLRAEGPALAAATAAHLDLVLEAIALAALVAIPLGIAASRRRWIERATLALANQLQTIPSLALLGVLLIALRSIGKPPALAALVLYSILPILKNTVLGLRSIDRATLESADAMGMTPAQRLRLVELPIAAPAILAGLRLAAVAAVGMATIAAAIGARGLGTYIFRGIALSDPRLILLGAVPAALLALLVDAALGGLERRLTPGAAPPGPLGRVLTYGLLALLLAGGLVGLVRESGWLEPRGRPVIRVGSKDSTEPILLGHVLAELIEADTGLPVDRSGLGLAGTMVCFQALASGGLDLYLEYTGTALTTILARPPTSDPADARRQVAAGLAPRGVTMLEPLGFENTFALLVRRDQATRDRLRTISDLARLQATLRAGFGPEFMNRPDGYPGLVAAYGLTFAIPPREMDRNLLYRAVAEGQLDLAAGDSTDGRIAALDLVPLVDDRAYFPPYEAVPLARTATLDAHPALRRALARLAGAIDADTMRRLNAEVELNRRDPRAVAREFVSALPR
jgi:osmoprotectant transport system permease protein